MLKASNRLKSALLLNCIFDDSISLSKLHYSLSEWISSSSSYTLRFGYLGGLPNISDLPAAAYYLTGDEFLIGELLPPYELGSASPGHYIYSANSLKQSAASPSVSTLLMMARS